MSYAGIDYGNKQTNINNKTGIRYGVIPVHDVDNYWYESSEGEYGNYCPFCGAESEDIRDAEKCDNCGEEIKEGCFDEQEPIYFFLTDGEYKAKQNADDSDIFILDSLYFTYAQFCSPCAPGACHLRSPLDEKDANNRCYCFGHDVFPDSIAPYPVYSVLTGEMILPL